MVLGMNLFRITFIPGTEKLVEKELRSKFPEAEISSRGKETINFQIKDLSIEKFRYMFSGLRIQDSNGKDIDLYKREWRKSFIPAGINPSLAYILCVLADIKKKDTVLDPFCGGSTIPISAALYFGVKKVFASDISGKAIDVSQTNWIAAGVKKDKYVLFRSDVSGLKLQPRSISKVITNLPFGIRVGNHESNERLYKDFSSTLNQLLTDEGFAIVLTQEKHLILKVMSNNFNVEVVLTPDVGGLRPNVYKITRKNAKRLLTA